MLPCIVSEGLITQEELELLRKVQLLMDDFPDIKFLDGENEIPISCHMFTRAIADVFPELTVKDGLFGRKRIEHSWLITSTRNFFIPEGNILDVYPSGQDGGPMFVWNEIRSPWRSFYVEYPIEVVSTPEFEHWLTYVKRAMRKKAELLKFIEAAE